MATYTSNYNLYMPDPTDPVGDFRSEFNSNMQTIDQNLGGGGGGGGHTIVNPSGSDMPAEGKLQFTGGVTVTDDSANGKTVVDISGGGGGGNVYGAFIDTNRVITSGNYSSSYSYTATEDCYLFFTCGGTTSSSGKLYLEGNLIRYIFVNTSDNNYGDGIYLKKGQTAEVQSPQAGTFQYIVYGLTQGTDSIFTPIIYSDTERVVGIWRDNKPLYQITIDLGSDRSFSAVWQSFALKADYPDYDYISAGMLFASSGVGTHVDIAHNDATYLELRPKASADGRYLTYQYTKATDVAGSGNWNTDGVPTVHYSTSEQVIGTWIDGKPLYEKTFSFSTDSGTNVTSYSHGIADIDTVTWYDGVIVRADGISISVNNGRWQGNADDLIGCIVGKVSISVFINYSAYRNLPIYVTMRYTKTTD